jgi:cysteine-rich repeat protein
MSLASSKYWMYGILALGCAGRAGSNGEGGEPESGASGAGGGPGVGQPGASLAPGPLGARATQPVPPEIPDFRTVDVDGDRIEDRFGSELARLERAAAGSGGSSAALVDEQLTSAAALAAPVRVLLHFDAPVTSEALAVFAAHGGALKKVYSRIAYALGGTLPRGRVRALATALGPSLLQVSGSQPIVRHLDEATRNGRVRPIWASGFAAGMSFSGSPTVNIAIIDSGVDGSHSDLAGRQELWLDCTADGSTTASDFGGHGTHVAGIALGSGTVFGTGPGTLLYTDGSDLSGLSSGSFFAGTLHLPATSLTFSGQATFLGGTNTTLSSVGATDGTSSWEPLGGTVGSGTSPLSFSVTFTPSASSHYSAAFLAPANHYAVAASVTNYPAVGDGFPALRGVASSSRWAGFKVFANDGSGSTLDIYDALQGVVDNAASHSIKIINMSLGLASSGATDPGLRSAVNTLTSNGILTVVSAGNIGPGGVVSDPGRTRTAITVGASSDQNRVTEYSSFGFTPSSSSEGTKPDLLAPGGSIYRSMILAPDTNASDADLQSFADRRSQDYAPKQGTSMAAPFVAGSAALVIQALESTGVSWAFTSSNHPLFVKMMLAAAATETTGTREGGGGNGPSIGRATTPKDLSEGWGIVNPDAAVEALRVELGTGFSDATDGGVFDRRAWGRKVEVTAGNELVVSLDVSSGADFDVYLYDSTPLNAGTGSAEGVPNRLASSTNDGNGSDESFSYTAASNGTRYLFVKRVGGSGSFTLTASSCGNGVVEADETCDDGNASNADCCSTSCLAVNVGSTCDDGDACTQTDTCQAGSCDGGSPVVCAASDPCHVAGTCDPSTGACSNPPQTDGAACDDGDPCTQADTCQAGSCDGGSPVVCAASDSCHVAGTCDPTTGACTNPRQTDGATCDDGDPCTTLDACSLGVCAPMGFVVCMAADECHTAGTCNPSTGTCSDPERDDGSACSGGECVAGVCIPDPSSGGGAGEATGGSGSQAGGGNASGSGGAGGVPSAGGLGGSGGVPAAGSSGVGGQAAAGGMASAGSAGASAAGDAGRSGSSQGAAAGAAGAGASVPNPNTGSSSESEGCGCSVPGVGQRGSYAKLGLAWLLVTVARRRRRSKHERDFSDRRP